MHESDSNLGGSILDMLVLEELAKMYHEETG